MALEVRYVPMKDEGDYDLPKIFRVIYQDDVAVSYSVASFAEVKAANPSVISTYFDLVSTYFKERADYVDTLTEFSNESAREFLQIGMFCLRYHASITELGQE
jgi:uncharacterized protein YozE (UPF0346 family)